MPLRETAEYLTWIERESPTSAAISAVSSFLLRVDLAPWDFPSVLLDDLADRPVSDFREARLKVGDEPEIWVLYRHFYAGDHVDLLAVTQWPSPPSEDP